MLLILLIIITACFFAYIIQVGSKYKMLLDEIEREDKLTNL